MDEGSNLIPLDQVCPLFWVYIAGYILHTLRHPVKHPSPCSDWKTNFGEGFFVADYREFFQTNNKSNRQMMSVFIYSSSNL